MNARVLDRDLCIVTVPDTLTPAECLGLIHDAEGIGFHEAPITTALGFVRRPDVRNNTP